MRRRPGGNLNYLRRQNVREADAAYDSGPYACRRGKPEENIEGDVKENAWQSITFWLWAKLARSRSGWPGMVYSGGLYNDPTTTI